MTLDTFDSWLRPDGPVALTISEPLEPVSAEEDPAKRVFFPPTYADPGGDKKKPYYVIDPTSSGQVCLIDSVASQANRMEPMFSRRRDLQGLTPKVTIKVKDRSLSLLEDLAHRAADAVIRCSDKGKIIRKAFLAYRDERNAVPLAKIAPTSLVFGAWDSRGDADDPRPTNVKLPRIVESTIRAYGADQLRRGATYVAALTEEERQEFALSGNSEEGFANALSQSPGGIIATNGIRREATLSFTPIRALGAPDHQSTESLQRYIFGLALVAFVATPESHLRQGCVLVASSQQPAKKQVVWRNGNREPFLVTENDAIAFAKAAADAFVVGPEVEAIFNPQSAKSARKSAGK